jgi:hypothetical protein
MSLAVDGEREIVMSIQKSQDWQAAPPPYPVRTADASQAE